MSLEELSREDLLTRVKELEARLKKNQKYGLVWESKEEQVVLDCKDKYPILKRVEDRSIRGGVGPMNYLIEGDNYHALKILQYTHKGKIDVIYIDPPYNTGNKDFIYNDDFVDKEDGYRHSKWLSFMERRLKLAKELLKDTGVIFISIDDNEQAQLKLLCDGVFGERNFISLFPRLTVKGGKTQSLFNTSNIDYVYVYSKDINKSRFNKLLVKDDNAFKYKDKYFDERGFYHTKQSLDSVSLGYVKSLDYPINHEGVTYYPGGVIENNGYRWTWSKDKLDFAIKNDFVEFKNGRIWPKKYLLASIEKDKNGYYIKYEDRVKNYSQLTFIENLYSNTNGTNTLRELDVTDFNNAKPVDLIKTICEMSGSKSSIILDFFAGSGTTGHAVLELNKQDGGNRQFILVTNNGDEKSEHKIAENITYERLKRVMRGYTNKKGEKVEGLGGNLDYMRCEFIDKIDHQDSMRLKITENCLDTIMFKEGNDKIIKNTDDYTITSSTVLNMDNMTAIYKTWNDENIDKFKKDIEKINRPVNVYLNPFIDKDEFNYLDKVNIKNIQDII